MKPFLTILFLLITSVAMANPLVMLSGSPPVVVGADYVPTTCYAYVHGEDTRVSIMGIYNSSSALVAQSAVSADYGASGYPKWITHTITGAPALTPGATYFIATTSDGYMSFRHKTSPSWQVLISTRGSWPNIPTAIAPTTDTGGEYGEPGMYCTNAAGTRLIGDSTTASFTVNGGSGSSADVFYYQSGYTCVTQ